MAWIMDVAFAVDVPCFCCFFVFFLKSYEQSKGVVQPVEQKLRQPFLPKLKKPIFFAIKLA